MNTQNIRSANQKVIGLAAARITWNFFFQACLRPLLKKYVPFVSFIPLGLEAM